MKIEHRFSFFIFQLAEKMNDPNIHALCTYSIIILMLCKSLMIMSLPICDI